jgi:hypothetical protein
MRKHSLSILIGIFLLAPWRPASADKTDIKKTKKAAGISESGHRVIYNLDCTEYFDGSFGPVVERSLTSRKEM